MRERRILLICALSVLTMLTMHPALQAAKKKHAAAKKEPAVKQEVHAEHREEEAFRQSIQQQVKDLQTDVYTKRATWEALQKVKQEADDTAGSTKLVGFSGLGIGIVIGCLVAAVVLKRMGKPDGDGGLKIT
jgi:hypothetical protein